MSYPPLEIHLETVFSPLQKYHHETSILITTQEIFCCTPTNKDVCLPVGILPLLYKIGNGNCGLDENTEIPVSRISHTFWVPGLDFKQQVKVP